MSKEETVEDVAAEMLAEDFDLEKDQEKLNRANVEDLLLGNESVSRIGGVKLRNMSLASIAVLQEAESPFISGGEDFSKDGKYLLDVCKFLYIQAETTNISEVAKLILSGKEDVLLDEALKLSDNINISELSTVVHDINSYIAESLMTRVEVTGSVHDSDTDAVGDEVSEGND